MANKLSNLKDKLLQARKLADNENEKLRKFTEEWNLHRISVCQNTLRSIVSILEENIVD